MGWPLLYGECDCRDCGEFLASEAFRSSGRSSQTDHVLLRNGGGKLPVVCVLSQLFVADLRRRFLGSVGEYGNAADFALAREYADRSASEVVMFSSVMRAQLSLAWVIGPPLSFMLALNYGFTFMYLIAAAVFILAIVLVAFMLPSMPRTETTGEAVVIPTNAFGDKTW